MNTEYPTREAFETALDAAFDTDYADDATEWTVVTEWSRMDSYGNYRDFTRTRTYRAESAAEALDMATDDLPDSCDAIIDQHFA